MGRGCNDAVGRGGRGIWQTVGDVDGIAIDAGVVNHLGSAPGPRVQSRRVCLKVGGVAGGGPRNFVRCYARRSEVRVVWEGDAGGATEGRAVHCVRHGGDEALTAFGREGDFVGEGAVETEGIFVDSAAPGSPVGSSGKGDGGYSNVLGNVGDAGAKTKAFERFPDTGSAGTRWGDFADKSARGLDEAGGNRTSKIEGPGPDKAHFAAVVLDCGDSGEGGTRFRCNGDEPGRVLDQQLCNGCGCYAEDGYDCSNPGDVSDPVSILTLLRVSVDHTST